MDAISNESTLFNLEQVAAVLESLEETIIYRLLDRAQFAVNAGIYPVDALPMPGYPGMSFLQVRLLLQERMDAVFGRFMVPEERPYSKNLPSALRPTPKSINAFPPTDFSAISQSDAILAAYIELVPRLCQGVDDGHYGSSVEMDVALLQALGRRIHFGALYVAESKYRTETALYRKMIDAGDAKAIMAALTRPEVEARILLRVREKLDFIQQRINTAIRRPVEPELIMDFYRDSVIPLTKAGEVAYLLRRQVD
jgi:chorismate mutase